MKNVNELREELIKVFDGVRDGAMPIKEASELNNAAGKIINTIKVELEAMALNKQTGDIPFLIYPGKTTNNVLTLAGEKQKRLKAPAK